MANLLRHEIKGVRTARVSAARNQIPRKRRILSTKRGGERTNACVISIRHIGAGGRTGLLSKPDKGKPHLQEEKGKNLFFFHEQEGGRREKMEG